MSKCMRATVEQVLSGVSDPAELNAEIIKRLAYTMIDPFYDNFN